MEHHVERLLNRISLLFAAVATAALLHLFLRSSCSAPLLAGTVAPPPAPFPSSSCAAAARPPLDADKRFSKLRSSRPWRRRVAALSAAVFAPLRRPPLALLSNASRALCVLAGAGHDVAALHQAGVADVTAVDVVDFPPFVKRADPHNLPFFDRIFDLGYTAGIVGALFPARLVAELERTVRRGGAIVVAMERRISEEEVEVIKGMFKMSRLLEVRNVQFLGSENTLIIMRKNGKPAS